MKIRTFVIALTLLACSTTVHAQDGTLDRVQNLIATGRLTEARNTLANWERTHGDPRSDASPDDRARALYLNGALSTDPQAAEDAFLGVVLGYPSAPVAPQALLRLGQGMYAAGDNERAISYLERLRSDYPRSPQRETGLLWLTRAQLAAGSPAAACGTARETLFGTLNENVRVLVEIERDRACAQSGGIAENSGAARRDAAMRRADDESVPALDANPTLRTGARPAPTAQETAPAAEARQPAADPRSQQSDPRTPDAARQTTDPTVVTSTAQRASPLPDLGVAVDDNMREAPRQSRTPDDSRPTDTRPTDTRPTDTRPTDTRPDVPAPRADPTGNAAAAAPVTTTNTASGPEFAVQTAAFSDERAARTIAAEMRAKGFDVRIVQVPGSPYYRVRVGAFMTGRDAEGTVLRIRDAGFATLIVNDVRLERPL